jgi:hypothetical protein
MPVRQAKNNFREKISEEIQGLSEAEVEKIMKMIHLVKKEFLAERRNNPIEDFRKAKGAWKHVNVENIYDNLNKEWKHWKPPVFA